MYLIHMYIVPTYKDYNSLLPLYMGSIGTNVLYNVLINASPNMAILC